MVPVPGGAGRCERPCDQHEFSSNPRNHARSHVSAVSKVIWNRFVWFSAGRFIVEDFQRPEGARGASSHTFRFPRLVEISAVHKGGNLFSFTGLKYRVKGFAETVLSLTAYVGFFRVSRVTLFFRTETAAGCRATHSLYLLSDDSLISTAYWCPKSL